MKYFKLKAWWRSMTVSDTKDLSTRCASPRHNIARKWDKGCRWQTGFSMWTDFTNFPFLFATLAKVSDRNSFRANQNYSDSSRYLYPGQYESFRTNPKTFFYLVWWKTVKNLSDLIRFNPRQQSEWIRTNPKPCFQSEYFRPRIHSNWFWL